MIDVRFWHGEDVPAFFCVHDILALSHAQLCVKLALINAPHTEGAEDPPDECP